MMSVNYLKDLDVLMKAGVIIHDPSSTYIDTEAMVSPGVEIGPNVHIIGKTIIEGGVKIEGSAYLVNSHIENEALIKFCVRAEDAKIGPKASVGPFANLRPGSVLEAEVKVGNFVEVKKSQLKRGAKASHLTYLGDTTVGEEANIGAGTITCNYDGYKKSKTEIGKGAFIGSNTALVAPVKVGDGASVGAGSVITKEVAVDDLAFTRAPLKVVPGWAKKKRDKNS